MASTPASHASPRPPRPGAARRGKLRTVCGLLLAALLLAPATGCVGATAHLLNVVYGGDKIKAQYPGLQGKRVAVVCRSSASSYGPDTSAEIVSQAVAALLEKNVRKIEVVHPDDVADWIDREDWNEIDYRAIGDGVAADMVVAIDLNGVRLHEGSFLYRGRANVTTTVFDMNQGGRPVFRRTVEDFAFPQNGPATEVGSEARFQRLFLTVLAQSISRYFYDYSLTDDFASDVALR